MTKLGEATGNLDVCMERLADHYEKEYYLAENLRKAVTYPSIMAVMLLSLIHIYISKDEQEEALADDVYARIQNVDVITRENSSHYSYFTDELISQVTDALVNDLGYTNTQAQNLLFSGGLEIHTTQDPDIQAIVDEEINNPENYDAAQMCIRDRGYTAC